LSSLAEERIEAYRARAQAAGWPAWLTPRCVQILNLLWVRGPMTRLELIRAMYPHLTDLGNLRINKKMHCNLEGGGGSNLSALRRAGFIYRVRKAARVTGRQGKSVDVYCLSHSIRRGKVYGQIADDGTITIKPGTIEPGGLPAAVDAGDAAGGPRDDQDGGH